jgi:hypothetical protein
MVKSYLRHAGLACAAAVAWAALSAGANAQPTAAQQSAMRSNCRSDFMSHCSGVTPGGKEALQCLQKNVAQLSPGCQAAVRATLPPPAPSQAAAPTAPPAPAAPSAPSAAAAPPPPPPATAATANTAPVVSAPPPHAKVVKPAPRHPVAAAAPMAPPAAAPSAAEQNAMRSHCRNDFMSLCRGVTPGGRDALACLQRNAARLSPSCRNVVSTTMHGPAAATPVATAPAEPPPAMEHAAPESREGFVPGGILINKACARYMLMHCRGMALDMGRKVACLVDYVNAGHFVGPRCKAALKLSGHLR